MKKNITIIDYGAGNLISVQNAIEFLGYKSIISNDPKIILNSEFLILPGVGSFYKSMQKLNKLKITDAIKKISLRMVVKFLEYALVCNC